MPKSKKYTYSDKDDALIVKMVNDRKSSMAEVFRALAPQLHRSEGALSVYYHTSLKKRYSTLKTKNDSPSVVLDSNTIGRKMSAIYPDVHSLFLEWCKEDKANGRIFQRANKASYNLFLSTYLKLRS